LGGEPLIDQPGSVLPASIDQSTPVAAGKMSVTDRPCASNGVKLWRATVKPAGLPSSTWAASAVLSIVTTGPVALHDGNLKFPMRVRQLNWPVVA
jgi:hypothetical protein